MSSFDSSDSDLHDGEISVHTFSSAAGEDDLPGIDAVEDLLFREEQAEANEEQHREGHADSEQLSPVNDEGNALSDHNRPRARPLPLMNLWSITFATLHESGCDGLRIDNLLMLIFSFLEADLPTLLSVSHVCRSWRERSDYLHQWRRVFIAQLPAKSRTAFTRVNSRTTLISAKMALHQRRDEAELLREAMRVTPRRIEFWSKAVLFAEFGAICVGFTYAAYWMGARSTLDNDVTLSCSYFFPALVLAFCLSLWFVEVPDDDEDENCCCCGPISCLYLCFDSLPSPFIALRTRHSAKSLLVVMYLIVLVMGTAVALMSIRVRRLDEWRTAHPSWLNSSDPVLYSFDRASSNATTDPSRWLPAAVRFERPELFRWQAGEPKSVNVSGAIVMVARLLELAVPVPVGAVPQQYGVVVPTGTNWSALEWPPGNSTAPVTLRTPMEAVGYFNLDPFVAVHQAWYSAWNASLGPPPPLLVGVGPTPEDLFSDYSAGLAALFYTDIALFGVCVLMFFLPRWATRCMWRCSLIVVVLTCNTIQMAVWGGVCYFRSAAGAVDQPPPYCLMSRASAQALFISGIVLTVAPQVLARIIACIDD
jgi:hypothetical protein